MPEVTIPKGLPANMFWAFIGAGWCTPCRAAQIRGILIPDKGLCAAGVGGIASERNHAAFEQRVLNPNVRVIPNIRPVSTQFWQSTDDKESDHFFVLVYGIPNCAKNPGTTR